MYIYIHICILYIYMFVDMHAFIASAASPAPTHPSTKESTTVGAAKGCFGSNHEATLKVALEVALLSRPFSRVSYLDMGNIAPTLWPYSTRRRPVFWFNINNRCSCSINKKTHVLGPRENMSAWSWRTHMLLCPGSARHRTNLEFGRIGRAKRGRKF